MKNDIYFFKDESWFYFFNNWKYFFKIKIYNLNNFLEKINLVLLFSSSIRNILPSSD